MTTSPGFVTNTSAPIFTVQLDNLSFDDGATVNAVDGGLWIGSSAGNPVATTISASNGVTVTNGPGSIGISFNTANVVDPYTTVDFSMSPYTVLESDYFISVDASGGAISLIFPSTLVNRGTWIVKDRLGNATTNNITFSTTGGYTIDGLALFKIFINHGSAQFFLAGTNFEVF